MPRLGVNLVREGLVFVCEDQNSHPCPYIHTDVWTVFGGNDEYLEQIEQTHLETAHTGQLLVIFPRGGNEKKAQGAE